jgi:hypothetical protein
MSYLTATMVASPILALTDKEKGDFTNRTRCMGEQLKARMVYQAQNGVIVAGTAAAGAVALKAPKVAKSILNGWDKAAAKFPKVAKVINSLPQKVKLLAPVAIAGLILMGIAADRFSFKKGKIDQKYNDRAKLKENSAI